VRNSRVKGREVKCFNAIAGVEGPKLYAYFVKHYSDSTKKLSETDIFNMLEFLMDNIFVMFGGRVFQQTVGITMGANCAPLLTDTFLYSYEADLIQGLLKKNGSMLKISVSENFLVESE
jgi:hypothetical protein